MDPNQIIISWKKIAPGMREGLMLIGTMLLVILLPFIWAVFLRKRGGQKHHHHSRASSHSHPEKTSVVSDDEAPVGRGRRHRRKREHRPRNPTLSETGGLPPIK